MLVELFETLKFLKQLKYTKKQFDSIKPNQEIGNEMLAIRNSLIYPYSNAKIEAKNTHIKTLKRVSYAFKSFENMKLRIFMMNRLIEVK
ncbi:transposase [Vagococcus lutrae]|uniref:transposase n=1 Tax=Vagococcus lutrae TaxID=81947 RepID=UPI0035313C3D